MTRNRSKNPQLYPVIGWVLTGLWALCFFGVFIQNANVVLGALSIQTLIAVVLLVLNICFRKEKRWGLWIVNALQLAGGAVQLLLALSVYFLFYGGPDVRKDAARLNLSGVGIYKISKYDDHDDFFGDGIRMKVYGVEPEKAELQMQNSEGWHSLPLDENAQRMVYGNENSGPYLVDSEGRTLAPEVQNGYWYFKDRHSQCAPGQQYNTDVLNRASVNFTLAIYNTQTERLYLLDMDT